MREKIMVTYEALEEDADVIGAARENIIHSDALEEEEEDVMAAASILVGMKHLKLETQTALELQNLKIHIVENMLPPMEKLSDLVEDCSKCLIKLLTESDIRDSQGRLAIGNKFAVSEILPILKLKKDDQILKKGIEVLVYDIRGNKSSKMKFSKWEKLYVLRCGWKDFYKEHRLKANEDEVHLWACRDVKTKKLCFAITWHKVRPSLGKYDN
ncbi:hypothetical protein FRX31_013271 [Thalictrum thalictroides]|uniref:B3 domain-containing protein n=1 Tax=Thalictrum thalictroides TaxID=46969 RepID=A0A7J6WJP9_THATH|nr:hypothetical protein FRX31_013271 [Thalictrum thalictroides]